MKKIILSALILLTSECFSQVKKTVPTKPIVNDLERQLLSTEKLLDHEIGAGSNHFSLKLSSSKLGAKDLYPGFNSIEVADKFDYFCSNRVENDKSIFAFMMPFHLKYKEKIKSTILKNTSMGKVLVNFQGDINSKQMPVLWSVSNGKDLNFLFSRVAYDKEFNTLLTTSRQRATEIFTSMIIPSLSNFSPIYNDSSIKLITIVIHYACRDFSQSSSYSHYTDIETLAFSAYTKDIKLFCEGNITEDEIVRRGIFQIQDKDMKNGIKKIELKIE